MPAILTRAVICRCGFRLVGRPSLSLAPARKPAGFWATAFPGFSDRWPPAGRPTGWSISTAHLVRRQQAVRADRRRCHTALSGARAKPAGGVLAGAVQQRLDWCQPSLRQRHHGRRRQPAGRDGACGDDLSSAGGADPRRPGGAGEASASTSRRPRAKRISACFTGACRETGCRSKALPNIGGTRPMRWAADLSRPAFAFGSGCNDATCYLVITN